MGVILWECREGIHHFCTAMLFKMAALSLWNGMEFDEIPQSLFMLSCANYSGSEIQ